MITKEQFEEFIKNYYLFDSYLDKLQKLQIDIIETPLFKQFAKLNDLFLTTNFTEEGVDWVNWWLYERVSFTGEINAAYDDSGEEIDLSSPSKLWDLVEKYRT